MLALLPPTLLQTISQRLVSTIFLLISWETILHKQSWGMILLSSTCYWSSSSVKLKGLHHFCQIKDYYILTYLEKE